MKVIIAGSRNINDYKLLCKEIQASELHITEVVCGMARGVDLMGKRWAEENNIPVSEFPADWNQYGKRAGYLRNEAMARYTGKDGGLIIIHNGSPGSKMMLMIASKMGLAVHEKRV